MDPFKRLLLKVFHFAEYLYNNTRVQIPGLSVTFPERIFEHFLNKTEWANEVLNRPMRFKMG